jgi:DNA-binding response OmpR family regulator
MRILIVEDNRPVAMALLRGLKPRYAIDVCLNGRDGLARAQSTAYDVILLDLVLPDIRGEDICTALRANQVDCPIIILTGNDEPSDKVSLLDMGADDYVTKPFSLDEVEARIRTAIRHSTKSRPDNIVVVGDLRLNPASREVTRGHQTIDLRRKEFELLEYMMRSAGRTLTRTMILEHVWDMNENHWANVVDVHIKHLRDKIDRPFGSHMIKTIHGVGYRLENKIQGKDHEI